MIENDLQNQCHELLERLDVPYFTPTFRGLHNRGTSKKKKGWSDDFIFINKTVIFVEYKTKTGKIRPEQDKKIDMLTKKGYKCFIVREFQQFIKIMEVYR